MLKVYLCLIISIALFSNKLLAQINSVEATDILQKQNFTQEKFKDRKVTYLFAEKKNVFVKYNPISLTFGGLLLFYQKVMSPQISANCPYEINCSNFSKQCIHRYGLLKGVALTADRLTRCTQFTLIDLHPSQMNSKNKIIDPIESYTLKNAHK